MHCSAVKNQPQRTFRRSQTRDEAVSVENEQLFTGGKRPSGTDTSTRRRIARAPSVRHVPEDPAGLARVHLEVSEAHRHRQIQARRAPVQSKLHSVKHRHLLMHVSLRARDLMSCFQGTAAQDVRHEAICCASVSRTKAAVNWRRAFVEISQMKHTQRKLEKNELPGEEVGSREVNSPFVLVFIGSELEQQVRVRSVSREEEVEHVPLRLVLLELLGARGTSRILFRLLQQKWLRVRRAAHHEILQWNTANKCF